MHPSRSSSIPGCDAIVQPNESFEGAAATSIAPYPERTMMQAAKVLREKSA
ncbi:hypothetical protein IQ268_16060 [Oculatella sp. LEGE 06141]|uniref:hypothetical protein n=1 Tax=Oculatella sp. LEGE 06141 TaxID=1828648 RepID=UPI00187E694B|nr:hypothetical protein [Oculatella sp. LEGE 06141]MBE9180086.1 hypothetical protein [Oculatella sp. LEGE 06141]